MARSLVKNAANERQGRFAERRERRREAERAALLAKQLSTVDGRAWVWGELERHGIDDLIDGRPEEIYRALGKREAGIQLRVEIMTLYPQRFLEMQAEAVQRATRQDAEVDAVQADADEKQDE